MNKKKNPENCGYMRNSLRSEAKTSFGVNMVSQERGPGWKKKTIKQIFMRKIEIKSSEKVTSWCLNSSKDRNKITEKTCWHKCRSSMLERICIK